MEVVRIDGGKVWLSGDNVGMVIPDFLIIKKELNYEKIYSYCSVVNGVFIGFLW